MSRGLGWAAGAAVLVAATAAEAHGFGKRYDLPIPLWLYLTGAGLAVGLSFVVMVFAARRAPGVDGIWRRDPLRHRALAWLGHPVLLNAVRAFGVGVFLLVIVAGALGNQAVFKNIAPVTVWVLWWVGMAFVSALAGNLWDLLNPWSTLWRWGAALRLPVMRGGTKRRDWPARCGVWPAFVLFLVFAWIELVWEHSEHPRAIALLIVAYSLITWTGMAVYGRRAWLAGGEAFSVVFGYMARFAPLHGEQTDGAPRLWLRPWAAGLLPERAELASGTAVVLAMLAIVSFDGLTETPLWAGIVEAGWVFYVDQTLGADQTFEAVARVDKMQPTVLAAIATAGLGLLMLVFWLVYRAFAWAMRAMSGRAEPGTAAIAHWFVVTLIPIAIAYHLAHYLSFLLIAGQYAIPLISDPLGRGWDLFGTKLYFLDIGIVDARFVWILSVSAIVAGHIMAVYLAHVTALRIYGDTRPALRSQIPMMVLMVGYTMVSLWILAQPIVDTG